MNSGLVILGILILGGMFIFGNAIITPQQRSQVELASGTCSSFFGKVGSAISGDIAEDCRTAQGVNQLLSIEPFMYLIGFGFLAIGMILPSGKKETKLIREVIKEPVEVDEEEEEPVPKKSVEKSKSKYCGNCGSKVTTLVKFCSDCGVKL